MFVFVLDLMTMFLSVSLFSSTFATRAGCAVSPSLPLTIVVVQLCAVFKLLAARLAHMTAGRTPQRETIRACGKPVQKNMIDRAYADLYRDDSRLLEILEL